MPFAATEYECEGLSVAFCPQVDLGAEATSASSERFTLVSTFGSGSADMSANDGAINNVLRPVQATFLIRLTQQCFEDTLPYASGGPAAEAAVDGRPSAEAPRNISPRSAGSKHPEDATDNRAMIEVRATVALLRRQQWKEA